MTRRISRRTLLVTGGAATLACGAAALHAGGAVPGEFTMDPSSIDLSAIDRTPAPKWEALSRKRIFFGHQSVGYNLLAGVADIARTRSRVRLDVVETSNPSPLSGPALAHSAVGVNRDPASKLRDFSARVAAAGPDGLDIALLKFCYVDVTASTDIDSLFSTYRDAIARLERDHPNTRFVHLTVPLTTPERGIKAGVKRFLGRRPWGYDDNFARSRFNERLRGEYAGKRPIADIASAESTLPDGSVATLRAGDSTFPFLAPCYTSDGGHLNEAGRVAGACVLLCALADAVA